MQQQRVEQERKAAAEAEEKLALEKQNAKLAEERAQAERNAKQLEQDKLLHEQELHAKAHAYADLQDQARQVLIQKKTTHCGIREDRTSALRCGPSFVDDNQ